ncbi:MAG: tRNA (N6-isopentenyl adenosine(37)-C2)-methylthiotransferase MiaB, partial [Endomicrobiales bacterium]
AIRECTFDSLFAFKYSPRPGTAAAHLSDDVAREDKERRLAEVLALSLHISRQKNAALVGTVQEVLLETAVGGRTRTNRKVFAGAREEDAGRLLPVKIVEARPNSLVGELECVP